jgi:hypothetical protein
MIPFSCVILSEVEEPALSEVEWDLQLAPSNPPGFKGAVHEPKAGTRTNSKPTKSVISTEGPQGRSGEIRFSTTLLIHPTQGSCIANHPSRI